MRHLRHIVLAALAVAMCAAPVASAHDQEMGGGHLVPPHARVDGLTAGQVMGEAWYRNLTLPVAENPLFGNGEKCARLGRKGKVLLAIGVQACTVPEGTTVYVIGITNFCDNVEPEPFFGADEAAQRKCAVAALAPITESIRLTVDGRKSFDLQNRRNEIFSPQRHVQLLADNFLGVPAGPATFTAWGWVAWLKGLPARRAHAWNRSRVRRWWHPQLGAGRQRRCGRPRRGRRLTKAGQVEVGYRLQRRRGEGVEPAPPRCCSEAGAILVADRR